MIIGILYGCFHKVGILFVVVLMIRSLPVILGESLHHGLEGL